MAVGRYELLSRALMWMGGSFRRRGPLRSSMQLFAFFVFLTVLTPLPCCGHNFGFWKAFSAFKESIL